MTRLVLVRHASTDWSGKRFCGRTDVPLSQAGRAEVGLLVARIAESYPSVATVHSSPARRAVETARPIASALGARLELDDRLREVDFGRVEGYAFDDVERSWPDVARSLLANDAMIDWPDGERAAELTARCRSFARELDTLAGDALVVTHGGTIRSLALLLGVDATSAVIAPGGVLVLERGGPENVETKGR